MICSPQHVFFRPMIPTVLLLALIVSVAAATDGEPAQQGEPETFRGLLVAMGNVALDVEASRNTSLNMNVTRWTTPEQRQQLLDALVNGTSSELFEKLRTQEEAGFLQVRSESSRLILRYAWQTPIGDQRLITLVADRLLDRIVTSNAPRLWDQQYTVIQLVMDADGSGTGAAAVSASISWDAEENTIKVGFEASEPVRITSVRKVR